MMRNLWGPQDVAAYCGVPVKTVYEWRSHGYGPIGKKVGKYVRYKPDDVERWFDGLAEGVI